MTQSHNVTGHVRLRVAGHGGSTGQLTVPSGMMQFLEVGSLFKPEFTDEGILYRFAGTDATAVNAPEWASRNGAST